jgi:hypothetical protein
VLGYDYDAGVAERKREKERGDDERDDAGPHRRAEIEAVAPPISPAMQLFAQVQENPDLMQMFATAFATAIGGLIPDITLNLPGEGAKRILRDEETGAIIGVETVPPVQ